MSGIRYPGLTVVIKYLYNDANSGITNSISTNAVVWQAVIVDKLLNMLKWWSYTFKYESFLFAVTTTRLLCNGWIERRDLENR